MPRPFESPNDMFHRGGDTCSNCQVSDNVDESCALVEFLDLCVFRNHDVRIRVGVVEKLQFLSEFGERGCFIASDKVVVFLDDHDTQRGEARNTYKNYDLCQLARFSLPIHVAELVADLYNLEPSVVQDTATALFCPLPHPNTVDRCLEMDDRV